MTPRYFDAREVAEALPIDDCVEAMRAALIATSRNRVQQPPRMIMPMPQGAGLALMPGFLQDRPLVGTKVVARFSPSEPQGRHRKAGVFLLFDRDTAQLRAIIDAHSLTNRRTAATTVAATEALARNGGHTVGIAGTGALARQHVLAFAQRRQAARIVVWGRNAATARELADACSAQHGVQIDVAPDLPALVEQCDVICTATAAAQPILCGRWLRPGQHVNAVGSSTPNEREIDEETIRRSAIFVDSRAAAASAAGELRDAAAAGTCPPIADLPEVGEVLAGSRPGRVSDDEITLFKSLGLFAEDCFAAEILLRSSD